MKTFILHPYLIVMAKQKTIIQLVWGIALVLMGIALFFRIPQVMPQIEPIGFSPFLVCLCFYLIALLLIGGGAKKIYDTYQKLEDKDQDG